MRKIFRPVKGYKIISYGCLYVMMIGVVMMSLHLTVQAQSNERDPFAPPTELRGEQFVPEGQRQTFNISLRVTKAEASNNAVALQYELSRAPQQGEQFKIVVVDSQNRTLVNRNVGTSQTGTINVVGQVGDTFSLQLRSADNTLVSVTSATAQAASSPTPRTREECEQSGQSYEFCDTLFGQRVSAPAYLRLFYSWAVGIAIFGATIMIIYAGYRYTTSRGNPSEINNAKEIIVSSLVGLALLLLSFTILRFLGVNVQLTNTTNSQNSPQNQTNTPSP